MSICSHEAMTNLHAKGLISQIHETLQTWRCRQQARRELSRWAERDLHDAGFSWSEVVAEADKPFWRA